ncbi:MAG: TetR/AcrR family transcriptional regulator [Solirubrobacteraceae bacterium]
MSAAEGDHRVLTAKGGRRAHGVLEATIACLGQHGYAGTSLQRVADLAGVQKRMVLYYFDSRERLIAEAFLRLANRFLDELARVVEGDGEPAELLDALFDSVLAHLDDQPLITAYLGLVAESAGVPSLREPLAEIRRRVIELGNRATDRFEAAGRQLTMQRELLVMTAAIAANGLGLELLQHGRTPALDRAIAFARAGAPLFLFE